MIDPALLKLMRLQGRGLFRRIGHGARTPRGAAFFAVGVLIFGLWIVSLSLPGAGKKVDPGHVRAVAPLILLGVCLLSTVTSAGEKAIAFTPGEVDFLFAGPFHRRELLAYKLGKSTVAALLTALVLSVALRRNAVLWVACYVGVFLTLLFIQFFSTALLLLGQTVSERAFSRGRRVALAAIGLLALVGLHATVGGRPLTGPGSIELPVLAERFARSEAGRFLLGPFHVFGEVITAERIYPDLVGWALAAAAINAVLLAVMVRLDANYLEAAAGASQRRYERLRRVRGGGVMSLGARGTARRGLPQPPFLFGVGPIAWRQLTHASRSARGLLMTLIVLAALCGPFLVTSHSSGQSDPSAHSHSDAAGSFLLRLFTSLAWMSILAASLMKFDFRADLDPMESLKTLPLRPWAVAAGQLVAPVLVLTAVHWVLLGAVAGAFGVAPAEKRALIAAAVLVAPFNLLLFAAENLVFLVFPTRPAAVGPGDFQVLGRQIFTLGLRTLLVVIGAAVAATFGVIAYTLSGKSLLAFTPVTGLILLLESLALLPLLAAAYNRFDPSAHTPAA